MADVMEITPNEGMPALPPLQRITPVVHTPGEGDGQNWPLTSCDVQLKPIPLKAAVRSPVSFTPLPGFLRACLALAQNWARDLSSGIVTLAWPCVSLYNFRSLSCTCRAPLVHAPPAPPFAAALPPLAPTFAAEPHVVPAPPAPPYAAALPPFAAELLPFAAALSPYSCPSPPPFTATLPPSSCPPPPPFAAALPPTSCPPPPFVDILTGNLV